MLVTTCICHGCDWNHLVFNGISGYQALGQWYTASISGAPPKGGFLWIDQRTPNGGGSITLRLPWLGLASTWSLTQCFFLQHVRGVPKCDGASPLIRLS